MNRDFKHRFTKFFSRFEIQRLYDEAIPGLLDCDIILVNGNRNLLGLSYDYKRNVPEAHCRYQGDFTYFLTKIMEDYGIPCVEAKLLTEASFRTHLIPPKCMNKIALYYSKFGKPPEKYKKDSFDYQLDWGVKRQYSSLEKNAYKKAIYKALEKESVQVIKESEVADYLNRELNKLADSYSYNYNIIRNSPYYSVEFILGAKDCNGKTVNNYVFITRNRSIILGNKHFLLGFYSEAANAVVNILEAIMQQETQKLPEIKKKYYEEFKINGKLWELAYGGITSLLKLYADDKNLKYSYKDFSKTEITIFLEKLISKDEKDKRMYKICITYKEFLRNHEAFREFLQNPKVFVNWNFWCKEVKYNEKKLKLT